MQIDDRDPNTFEGIDEIDIFESKKEFLNLRSWRSINLYFLRTFRDHN